MTYQQFVNTIKTSKDGISFLQARGTAVKVWFDENDTLLIKSEAAQKSYPIKPKKLEEHCVEMAKPDGQRTKNFVRNHAWFVKTYEHILGLWGQSADR